MTMISEQMPLNFQKTLIHLFQGIIYQQEQSELWTSLLSSQAQIQDYVNILGLQLLIDEAEGYAYLRQRAVGELDAEIELPRLIQKRSLSFPASLLCILLRKKLLEEDASGGELRVMLTEEQIIQMMQIYLPSNQNEVRTVNVIQTAINKVIELGILRRLTTDHKRYEIKRIIKALIDADWLVQLEQKLSEYKVYGEQDAELSA